MDARDDDGPEAVATRLFDALHRRDWASAAELIDEEDVAEWYGSLLARPDAPLQLTPHDVTRLVPGLTLESAERQLDEVRRNRELYSDIGAEVAGVGSRDELQRLSPRQALERFLEACDPVWRFESYFRRTHPQELRTLPTCPDPPSRMREVVGVLREEGDQAWLAYRTWWAAATPAEAAEEVQVAALRRTRAGWRMRRAGEIFEPARFTIIDERSREVER